MIVAAVARSRLPSRATIKSPLSSMTKMSFEGSSIVVSLLLVVNVLIWDIVFEVKKILTR